MREIALAAVLAAPVAPAVDYNAAYCLALVAYHEARSEIPLAQLGVIQVALNRWANSDGTLCDVVMRPGQFHVPSQPAPDDIHWIEAQVLAENVMTYAPPDVTGGALFFSSDDTPPTGAPRHRPLRLGKLRFWR
ncbi:MAG: cell wall hydrolase [Gammaproteobacteria bacterium]